MNILASVEFSMAALNFGVMIWSIGLLKTIQKNMF